MSNIFLLQKAALFADDDNPTTAHRIDITSVKLPMVQEGSIDHKPGGGILAIQIGNGQVEALTVNFKMKGIPPDLLAKFGLNSARRRKYTIRGAILDVRDGVIVPSVAVVNARMKKADIGDFSVDNGADTDFDLQEIDFYSLEINGQEKYYVDFWNSVLRIDGIDTQGDTSRALGMI